MVETLGAKSRERNKASRVGTGEIINGCILTIYVCVKSTREAGSKSHELCTAENPEAQMGTELGHLYNNSYGTIQADQKF